MTETPVSQSLGATFSELIGQPTPPELRAPLVPSIATPVTGTTETLPSSVASLEPPRTTTSTLEVSTTATAIAIATTSVQRSTE